MNEPRLSVVVLAWNQLPLTRRCVESVRANTDVPYELIVVDNGSDPEAAAYATSVADVPVRNDENVGFAAGMNTGLRAASGHRVAFLNNDTEVPPGWASPLLATFDDFPTAGIVLPAVTAAGNPYSVRTEPGTERAVVPPFRNLPSGVVYVMDRATAEALGGWDERYGRASAEDLDLLWKVWVNGLDVVLDERVLVAHVGSASVEGIDDRTDLYRRNRLAFAARWSSGVDVPDLGRIEPADFARRVEAGAAAATWMGRAFASEDSAEDLRRELRNAERRPAASPPGAEEGPHRRSSGIRRWLRAASRRVRRPRH
jgi:GT2 family glycosyltransferase